MSASFGGHRVVIGVGNPYRRDDGVGPAVVERLRGLAPPAVRFEESEGEPSELLELWTGADLAVVVDAVRAAPSRPGRIHHIRLDRAQPPVTAAASSHGVDLGAAVALARVLDRMPATLVMYGVEVTETAYGAGLTPAVAAAAEVVASAILAELTGAEGSDRVPV